MKALWNQWGLPVVTAWVLHWQECGENPAIFCYRMGVRLSARVRRDELLPEKPPRG